MSLYMDFHKADGATAQEIADAHEMDEEVQGKYGVRYVSYWFNEAAGRLFCLVEAPNVNAAIRVHREAHGLLADEIIEVKAGSVDNFLGTPQAAPATLAPEPAAEPALDTALRTILFTDMAGSTALTQRLGDAGAMSVLRTHNSIIRDALQTHDGSEVKHTGDGIMASFVSVAGGVGCAIAIQRGISSHIERQPDSPIRVRIGLTTGEPVTEHDDLFGTAVQLAARICDCAEPKQILVSNVVRELCIGKDFGFERRADATLKGFDEPVALFEVPWA